MEKDSLKNFIDGVLFFKEFSDHEKEKIAGNKNTFKQFEKGDEIFKEGDEGASLFVVLFGSIDLYKLCDADNTDGRVSLKDEMEKLVGELKNGSVFGEISMLTGRKRSVTARISSPKSVVMEITLKLVDGLIPSIQAKFHKQLLMTLVKDLDDMDIRYIKLQSSIEAK